MSLNNQKITNLATPTLSADAVTKDYVDTKYSELAYMTFSITIGDILAPTSYTSTNNFITNVAFTLLSAGKGYYTVSVDTTKVFSGADYYVLHSIRSTRATVGDPDNDMNPLVTMVYQKTSFIVFVEETVSGN